MISSIELIKKLEGEEIVKAVFSTVQENVSNVDYINHKIYGHTEVLDKLTDFKDKNFQIDDFVIVTKKRVIFNMNDESNDLSLTYFVNL